MKPSKYEVYMDGSSAEITLLQDKSWVGTVRMTTGGDDYKTVEEAKKGLASKLRALADLVEGES